MQVNWDSHHSPGVMVRPNAVGLNNEQGQAPMYTTFIPQVMPMSQAIQYQGQVIKQTPGFNQARQSPHVTTLAPHNSHYSQHQIYISPHSQNRFIATVPTSNSFEVLNSIDENYPPLPSDEAMNLGSANPKEVEGIINFPNLGLSHDLGKRAKRAISPTLLEENNRVAKSRYTAPPKYQPKNKGIQILDRFDNRVILSSNDETKTLPMERETTLSLKETLKPEHFEFELSKDKKRVTIFLPTKSAVAKALTINKVGETEVQAEEFKPRCQGVIRGIPKEITEEEIKSDLESEANASVKSVKRLKRFNREIKQLEDSLSVCITFENNLLPSALWLYGRKREVQEYQRPIIQCFKCQKYGHMQAQCRAPKPVCLRCVRPHPSKDCELKNVTEKEEKFQKYSCVNCRGNHSSTSGLCRVRDQNKNILRLSQEKNIGFNMASIAYRSYADALNKKQALEINEQNRLQKEILTKLVIFVSSAPEVVDLRDLELQERVQKLCSLMKTLFNEKLESSEILKLINMTP
jgi:hypothetical protein